MKRVAFKMKLKPGVIEEYTRRHNEIWPELTELLKENGVSEYSIFFDEETNSLLAYQINSSDGGSQSLGAEPIVQKWWDYMSDLMEVNPDNSPVSKELPEVFFLQ